MKTNDLLDVAEDIKKLRLLQAQMLLAFHQVCKIGGKRGLCPATPDPLDEGWSSEIDYALNEMMNLGIEMLEAKFARLRDQK